jgi:hypothetical protein
MNNLKLQHISLKSNEVKTISSKKSQKLSLVCQHGTVWATVIGDSRDYILSAGEKVEFECEKGLLVQSLSSDLEIELEFEKTA